MSINRETVETIAPLIFQVLTYHHPTKEPFKFPENSKIRELVKESYTYGVNNIEGLVELELELRRIVPKRGKPLSKKLFNWVHTKNYSPNAKQVLDEIYNVVSKMPKMFPALYDVLKGCGYSFKKVPKA